MAITPLNQLDIYRIVHDFDQDHFNTAKPLRDDQVGRIIVIIQLERMLLLSHLPIELIDDIMRRCLENSPSVGASLAILQKHSCHYFAPSPPPFY